MKKRFFTRKKIIWFAVILVVAGGVGWWGYSRYKSAGAKKAEAMSDSLVTVTRGDMHLKFKDSGEIAAKYKVDIVSNVGGRITELFVKEGDKISAGGKLAVIQPGRSESERYIPITITSPISGIIMRYVDEYGKKNSYFARIGDRVSGLYETGTPTYLLCVANLKRLIVRLKISEMDVLKLRSNMKVDVTIDAIPGVKLPGRVSLVSPQAEKDNSGLKMFKVEVTLKKTHSSIMPGMTARVESVLDTRKNVLKLPLSGLFEEMGKTLVYLEVPGGKPKKTVIQTGLRTETDIEVLGGIKEKDKVYTEKPKK